MMYTLIGLSLSALDDDQFILVKYETYLYKLDGDFQGARQVNQATVRRTGSVKQIEGRNHVFSC